MVCHRVVTGVMKLPMFPIAHLYRHGKCRFVSLPAICDGVSLRIKVQFKRGNGSMAEILVEDRGQLAPTMFAKVCRDPLIPTAVSSEKVALSAEERNVYDLICRRLLSAWHEDH